MPEELVFVFRIVGIVSIETQLILPDLSRRYVRIVQNYDKYIG